MKKILLAALAAIAVGSYAYADGEWIRASSVWFKGVVYAGSSKLALTNSTGNLATTTGTFSGAVGVNGALSVTGAATLASTLNVTAAETLASDLVLTDVANVAATGATGPLATLLSHSIQAITGATGGLSVVLPTGPKGLVRFAYNFVTQPVSIYANTGETVNQQSLITAPSGSAYFCVLGGTSGTAWFCSGK